MRLFKHRKSDNVYDLVAKSKYFNKRYYLKTYPDVAHAKIDPVKHFIEVGWKEGRNPSKQFNTNYYISNYMKSQDVCPLLHYEKHHPSGFLCPFDDTSTSVNNKLLPAFSIIVPTYNRAKLVVRTIHNILGQQYQNFEIIIVDDGSTDNTKEEIYNHFAPEIKSKKIKYFLKKHAGVCKARNFGLSHAKNDWIAYADSDNLLFPVFFNTFAQNIIQFKKYKTFYCMARTFTGVQMGKEFDYQNLLSANYIDLGTFVHHKDIYKDLGGFDENMTRLVDWDLIARYTKKYKPWYIKKTCMLYNDTDNHTRITNNTDLTANMEYFHKKHCKNRKIGYHSIKTKG